MVLAARARAWPYIRKYSIPLEGAAVQPIGLLYKCEGTLDWYFFFFFSFISLIADGPHHYHPACGHKGSSHLSPVHALQFFYRDASSALLQLVNQWLKFTYSRSHAFRYERKNTNKSYFGKNRTHDFRTSRSAGYLLDHSGDERRTSTALSKFARHNHDEQYFGQIENERFFKERAFH